MKDEAKSPAELMEWIARQTGQKTEPPVRSSELVVPRDCCAEYSRSAHRMAAYEMRNGENVLITVRELNFCPWCGLARHNAPSSPTPP